MSGAIVELIIKRPWAIVACWLVVMLMSLPVSLRLGDRLARSHLDIPGSQAVDVMNELTDNFVNPYIAPLVVVIETPARTPGDPALDAWRARLRHRLASVPDVLGVVDSEPPLGLSLPRLRDAHAEVWFIGRTLRDRERSLLPPVREIIQQELPALKGFDSAAQVYVTGAGVLEADIVGGTMGDSATAERRVLLPALVLLMLVFGTPLAAAMPVLLGAAACLLAMALLVVVTDWVGMNGFAQTTVSMIGLALGIDYSLLVVSRFREARRGGASAADAVRVVFKTAVRTVLASGCLVVICMAALLILGTTDAYSVGVAGVLVVGAALVAVCTLLPALLLLGDRWLDWPAGWSRLTDSGWGAQKWLRWGAFVQRHRFWLSLGVLALLLAIAWNASRAVFGVPETRHFPAELEAVKAASVLKRLNGASVSQPIPMVVSTRDTGGVLGAAGVKQMLELSRRLHEDPRIKAVLSPVDLRPGTKAMAYRLLYANAERALQRYPAIATYTLSRDHRKALFLVWPQDAVTLKEAEGIVAEYRRYAGELAVAISGNAAFNLDYRLALEQRAPWCLTAVFVGSFVLLGILFRSILIPFKAILLNLLAVSASLGALVLVFQDGWLSSWIGLAEPINAWPLFIPVLVFCVTFGLSMDYEIFLLSRVREARSQMNEEQAILAGMGQSGSIIAAAALMMILVFGSFAFARIVFTQLFGLGLAVAILLDATLIRAILAPALLLLAGRWNWWPGDRTDPKFPS